MVLWHINHGRLFNAKSIFILINSSISSYLVKNVKWFKVFLCITNNSIKHQSFIYTVKCQFSSIWPTDKTLSNSGSDDYKGVFCIPQSFSIRLFSVISGHSLGNLTRLQRCSRCILQPQLTGQNTYRRSMWITRRTMLKNKPYLVNLWTFQSTLVSYSTQKFTSSKSPYHSWTHTHIYIYI